MTTGQVSVLVVLVIWLLSLLVFLGIRIQDVRGIRTDAPITPELRIRVTDGVADTTYIYRIKD